MSALFAWSNLFSIEPELFAPVNHAILKTLYKLQTENVTWFQLISWIVHARMVASTGLAAKTTNVHQITNLLTVTQHCPSYVCSPKCISKSSLLTTSAKSRQYSTGTNTMHCGLWIVQLARLHVHKYTSVTLQIGELFLRPKIQAILYCPQRVLALIFVYAHFILCTRLTGVILASIHSPLS